MTPSEPTRRRRAQRPGRRAAPRELVLSRSHHRRHHQDQAQALVEFAIMLPILAVLLGSGFTAWQALNASIAATDAAKAAAAQAAYNESISSTPGSADWGQASSAALTQADDDLGCKNPPSGAHCLQLSATSGNCVNCVVFFKSPSNQSQPGYYQGSVTLAGTSTSYPYDVTTVWVNLQVIPDVPFAPPFTVHATATAGSEPGSNGVSTGSSGS